MSKEMEVLKDDDDYVDSFKPHLMGVVLEWAKGTSFVKITQMTNIYEGNSSLLFIEPSDIRMASLFILHHINYFSATVF